MKKNEAKAELEKIGRGTLRYGILAGIAISIAVLGLSFVRPHWDYIITVGFWPALGYAIYFYYIAHKADKLRKLLQTSEGTES